MQPDSTQLVGSRLKEARTGIQKYLGAETEAALHDLLKSRAEAVHEDALKAYNAAVSAGLDRMQWDAEALILELFGLRSSRPEVVVKPPRKRVRKAAKAVAQSAEITGTDDVSNESDDVAQSAEITGTDDVSNDSGAAANNYGEGATYAR